MVYRTHAYEIDQGDILEEVPFVERRASQGLEQRALGLVTAHGCTCEKYTRERDEGADEDFLETYTIHVTPLMAASRFPEDQLGNIRAGRVKRYFALPPAASLPELIVDLNLEQPVPAMLLLPLRRRASLDEDQWLRLIVHRFAYQTRLDPESVFGGEEA